MADDTSVLGAIRAVRDAIDRAGMIPLVVAPLGGHLHRVWDRFAPTPVTATA